jgi:hypothetical protein
MALRSKPESFKKACGTSQFIAYQGFLQRSIFQGFFSLVFGNTFCMWKVPSFEERIFHFGRCFQIPRKKQLCSALHLYGIPIKFISLA